jgi:hypothetical protein
MSMAVNAASAGRAHARAAGWNLVRYGQGATATAAEDGSDCWRSWMRSFGRLHAVGVEGTGSYGAGLARHLRGQDVRVVGLIGPTASNAGPKASLILHETEADGGNGGAERAGAYDVSSFQVRCIPRATQSC